MKKILFAILTTFSLFLSGCSDSENKSKDELLDMLKLNDFYDSCFHFPLIVESPYQEFNSPTKGGIYFGGSDLSMNYKYSYFKNSEAQIMGDESIVIERGIVSDIAYSNEKDRWGFKVPIIKGKWSHISDKALTGTLKIMPVVAGLNAGKIYYSLKGGSNWKVYGFKHKSQSEYERIVRKMCEISDVKYIEPEVKKNGCECIDLVKQLHKRLESGEITELEFKQLQFGCIWLYDLKEEDTDKLIENCGDQISESKISKDLELALVNLGYDILPLDGEIDERLANNIQELNLSNQNISDLSGIENFSNLGILDISDNNISFFDPSVLPNLNELWCSGNTFDCEEVQMNLKQK
jgi:hypothetical protein